MGWAGAFCQSLEGQGKVWVDKCKVWVDNCKVWVDNCKVWEGNEHKSPLVSKRAPSHLSRHCQFCGNFAAFYLESLNPKLLTPVRGMPPPPRWAGNHPRLCPGEVFRDVHPPQQLRFPRFAALLWGTMSEPGQIPSAPFPADQSRSPAKGRERGCSHRNWFWALISLPHCPPGAYKPLLTPEFFQVLRLD